MENKVKKKFKVAIKKNGIEIINPIFTAAIFFNILTNSISKGIFNINAKYKVSKKVNSIPFIFGENSLILFKYFIIHSKEGAVWWNSEPDQSVNLARLLCNKPASLRT